ncbi:DNA-binding protein [Marinomonas fungiae]|uniref:baseplate complex protein n=1 Tax=Marinomonas fungiae TaxID=1137284 RepID=UPI003A95AAAE
MILALNGKNVRGWGFVVTGEQPLPDEDLSAQTSSTLTAEKGFKGKRLRVKLNINFDNEGDLKRLVSLAQAVDSAGKRQVYTVNNQTASAMGVRQVRFSERLNAQEMEDKQAWSVTFVLLEHKSVPEKRESKALADTNNQVTTVATADQQAEQEAAAEVSWFEENLLMPAESWLSGGDEVDVV